MLKVDFTSLRELLTLAKPKLLFTHVTNSIKEGRAPHPTNRKKTVKGYVHGILVVFTSPIEVGGVNAVGRWSYMHVLGHTTPNPEPDDNIRNSFASQRLLFHTFLKLLEKGELFGDEGPHFDPFEIFHGVLGSNDVDRPNGIVDLSLDKVMKTIQADIKKDDVEESLDATDTPQEPEEEKEQDGAVTEEATSSDSDS